MDEAVATTDKPSRTVTVWIQHLSQVPSISSLIGIPINELETRYWEAWGNDRLCVFDVDVTFDQYEHIKIWHMDNQINAAYVQKENRSE